MSHDTWNYQDALRRAGYRVTPQRERIMDLVCAAEGRLTAQALCDAVHHAEGVGEAAAMSPATVYRNVRFLTERKLLRSVEVDGCAYYELAGPHASHHHLVCRVCRDETEIPEDATEAFYARIVREHGFRVEDDHLVLTGVCRACRSP